MLNNMTTSLFRHERIQTTLPKAKELRRYAEKLITRAKKDSTHSRRIVFRSIRDKEIIGKLFDQIAPRFADRNGGYIRILKLDFRMADGAPTAVVELVGSENVKTKKPKKEAEGKQKESKKEKAAAPVADKKADKAKAEVKEETEKAETPEHNPVAEAAFKKSKARDGAREAFMDRASEEDEKVEKRKKLFDRWKKKEKEVEEPVKKSKKAEPSEKVEEMKAEDPENTVAEAPEPEEKKE